MGPTDHTEFIVRHHQEEQKPTQPEEKRSRWWVLAALFFMAIVYLALCILIAYALHVNVGMIALIVLVFIGTFAGSISIQHVRQLFSKQEKERKLLLEIMEGSRTAQLVTDPENNTIYANRKFRVFCKDGDACLSGLARALGREEEIIRHFRDLSRQARRGAVSSLEFSTVKDDKITWYKVVSQPVAGRDEYVHWRVDDITVHHEADRAVQEEREKLIDFTDNAPVGFFSVDENGHFVFMNATLARWLGQDIEILLKTGSLHNCLLDIPEDAAPYDVISGGGARQVAEVKMKGGGGRVFLASVNQAVVHEGEGIIRTRGVVHDLTDERAMHLALKASEDRFQRFFEEAPIGIVIINPDGVVSDCNAEMAAILKDKPESLNGMSFDTLVSDKDRKLLLSEFDRIHQGQIMEAPMEVVLDHNKKEVPVRVYVRRFRESNNLLVHFIDLTTQKTLEQQFAQSQKMQAVGQLAGGVAHDFNNLLTAIIGYCDLLLLRHKPGDPSFADIMQIQQNSNRAANLVRQLLAFSRQQTLRPAIYDVTDILTEISHLIRRLIGANIEFDLRHGSDLGLIRVDEGQMEQVLVNLSVNARDAMDANETDDGHKKLMIHTSAFENSEPMTRGGDEMPPGEWVLIEVADTGCGISKEHMAHIFEPFFTTKDVGKGTGLGLATVHGIVRQTGGYLHVESEQGKGTSFFVYLPVISEEEAAKELADVRKEEEETTKDLTGTARILLVEDEESVRTFSSRALTNKGYEVLTADCGDSAVTLMEDENNQNIDLLITDVIMPNMDGPTLAKHMRETSPKLKIIFISGYTEEKLKDYMGENIWFLPKPFSLKELASKVKSVLND